MATEKLTRIIDEHWTIYVRPLAFAFAVFVAGCGALYLAGVTMDHSTWMFLVTFLVGLTLLLLSIHGFFITLLSESLSQIVITNRRLVHFDDTVPFSEEMIEVSFDKMKTVEVEKHGFFQSIFNYGTLNFENGKAKIHFVPHPSSVARDVYQAMGML